MMQSLPSRRTLANLRIFSCRKISNFSTSSPKSKIPQRSPKVRANESARRRGVPSPRPQEKWPLPLLEGLVSSHECFAIVTLKDVVAILNDFEALGLAMAKTQAKAICSEHKISATAMYVLGRALLDNNDVKYRNVATTLLICTLEGWDPTAASYAAGRLLSDAMLTGRHNAPGLIAARKLVQENARKQDIMSVYLEGKLLEYEGKPLQALQIYQTWSDTEIEHRKSPRSRDTVWTPEFGDVCKALARLRAKLGDRSGAEEAIRDAALVYDDPAAYYHLAIEFVAPGSAEFETYLLKAASSDQPRASHELGLLYFNQSRQGVSLNTPNINHTTQNKVPSRDTSASATATVEQHLPKDVVLDKRAEAMEWFNIGAESGITASQVYFALLLRDVGRADEGLEWLQRASKSEDASDWIESVDYFKRMWRLSAPDPMLINIESLRKSNKNSKKPGASSLASLDDATLLTDPFQRMKKIDGVWRINDREGRKFLERMAASWR